MESVTIVGREETHIAGLLLARLLERSAKARPGCRLPAPVVVNADGMTATVYPVAHGHEVRTGADPAALAEVRAPLLALVALAGGGSVLGALLSGGLRVRGSVRALWALRGLLRSARAAR